MAKSKDEIIQYISEYINDTGGSCSSWYVGTCQDAYDKLFFRHNVKQKGDDWFYIRAMSPKVASEVGDYFKKTIGTDGGRIDPKKNEDIVYTYKKVPHTDP